jgi:F-box/leucine-rich repeat protein 10/11
MSWTGTLLKAFENWTFSGKQGDVFFGDMVEKCGRMVLNPGNTFFIPSGWIHAVYTPVDSLVFGGNYLHPFGIERQIKISILEETLKVPHKFRFPFFAEMMWYLLDKYCYALLGRY